MDLVIVELLEGNLVWDQVILVFQENVNVVIMSLAKVIQIHVIMEHANVETKKHVMATLIDVSTTLVGL